MIDIERTMEVMTDVEKFESLKRRFLVLSQRKSKMDGFFNLSHLTHVMGVKSSVFLISRAFIDIVMEHMRKYPDKYSQFSSIVWDRDGEVIVDGLLFSDVALLLLPEFQEWLDIVEEFEGEREIMASGEEFFCVDSVLLQR